MRNQMDNKLLVAIIIYLILVAIIIYIHPSVLYNENGTYREFGIGQPNKTAIPLWLVMILIAPLSYVSATWLLQHVVIV